MKRKPSSITRRLSNKRFNLAGLFLVTAFLSTSPGAAVSCGVWDKRDSPNVGNSVTRLTGISSASPDDAWSVGFWRSEPTGRGPLVLHWDGSVWTEMDLPDTSALGSNPETVGVKAISNGDVWVVGNVTTTYPTYNLPLVLRWRGTEWDYANTVTLRPQTVHPFAARGGFAQDVDALAADDIWVVGIGAGFGDGQATTVPLAIHWDGSNWTDVEVPRVSNRHHDLKSVVAISPNDVWAVGDSRNVAGPYLGVTYHWNGSEWSHVSSPIEAMPESSIEDVVANGPNNVWALGNAADVGVVVMHWNGSQWSTIDSPPNSGGSMAAVGPDDLWISGWNGYWHWDGTTWTEVPVSVPGAAYSIRSGEMAIVGECDIWCAGFWTEADGITSYILTEHLQSSSLPSPTPSPGNSSTPTIPPSPSTATPMPTGTPTVAPGACDQLTVTVNLATDFISPGVDFWVFVSICNPSEPIFQAPFFAVLDIGTGDYWFYPAWVRNPSNLTFKQLDLITGVSTEQVIPTFSWPDTGTGSFGPIWIHSAVLSEDLTQILGKGDSKSFMYGP